MAKYLQLSGDCAVFTCAIQDGYSSSAVKNDGAFRSGNLPSALPTVRDLNLLDPQSRLLHTDAVLVSFGQYINHSMGSGILGGRDRTKTLVIGDSGGYQFATGARTWSGDATRRAALRWLEKHADIAMTLDIPTRAIDERASSFRSFDDCLGTTIGSLKFFADRRTGATRLLNVLQGRNFAEADVWFEAVKDFPFEGWAFAGELRQNPYYLCRRIFQMAEAGLLDKRRNHIHVLGTARLSTAVLLTAIQRALRKTVVSDFRVTFDAASPSLLAANYKAFSYPTFSSRSLVLPSRKVPRTADYIGSQAPFPFTMSAVGRRLKIGDICVRASAVQQSAFDVLSGLLLTNHNMETLLAALKAANGIVDFLGADRKEYAPAELLRAVDSVTRVLETPSAARLAANRRTLEAAVTSMEADEMEIS